MTRTAFNVAMMRRGFLRLFGNKDYSALCDKEWVVSPAVVCGAQPGIWLENDMDGVTALAPGITFENEKKRLSGDARQHAATIARRLKNVHLFDGHIYKGPSKLQINTVPQRWRAPVGDYHDLPSAALACSWITSKYFGHWMKDGLPLIYACNEVAPPIRDTMELTEHQRQYMHYLDLQTTPVGYGRIRELVIFEDFGQNAYKRARYDLIRNRFHPQRRSTHPGVMVLRGGTGEQRRLVNEMQIADHLRTLGFQILDPHKHSAAEIIAITKGARMLVSVEGSQLSQAIYSMAEGGTLLALQPPFRFNNVYKDITDCLDLRYAFVVGELCEGGFKLPIEKLDRIMHKIDAIHPH